MPNDDFANTSALDAATTGNKVNFREAREVSLEYAFDLIGELRDKQDKDFKSAQVVQGIHPILGAIYIIIQAFGGALILPFAFHTA